MAVALHKRMLRAIAHLGMGGCADIVFYCSGLRPALCRIRTSSGKALTSNPHENVVCFVFLGVSVSTTHIPHYLKVV